MRQAVLLVVIVLVLMEETLAGWSMDKASLESMIADCFKDSGVAPNGPLLAYDACRHEECEYIIKTFAGRRWSDIARFGKPYRDDFFFFLSTDAYGYYLPAFMFIVLDRYDDADVMVNAFLRTLHRSASSGLLPIEELNNDRLRLSARQAEAVEAFLEFVCNQDGNSEACNARGSWRRQGGAPMVT